MRSHRLTGVLALAVVLLAARAAPPPDEVQPNTSNVEMVQPVPIADSSGYADVVADVLELEATLEALAAYAPAWIPVNAVRASLEALPDHSAPALEPLRTANRYATVRHSKRHVATRLVESATLEPPNTNAGAPRVRVLRL
jgi:hypothetical protein